MRHKPENENEQQWREKLTREEYRVLREGGTEAAWRGEYVDEKRRGVYRCRACGEELFASDTKFDSQCGWPSFWTPLAGDKVRLLADDSLGMQRTEVRCANCDSHMGHVFYGEGWDNPEDARYCINSISLTLEPETPAG